MTIVVVPNILRDQINNAIDEALGGRPCTPDERDRIYHALLSHFNYHGRMPEFQLAARKEAHNGA